MFSLLLKNIVEPNDMAKSVVTPLKQTGCVKIVILRKTSVAKVFDSNCSRKLIVSYNLRKRSCHKLVYLLIA